jgi:uncharacterized protein (DUF2267 family)
MINEAVTLDAFYMNVANDARLPTTGHAERWTHAVLRTMGFNLSGSAKRDLAAALPDELGAQLTRGWKLINLHNPRLTQDAFLKEVARRSGNTDAAYSRKATGAVFHNLKAFLDDDMTREVNGGLPRDVAELWNAA